ncbi:MAG TPA: Stk1 family PASTA domain-containing Ser/Thr kinase [Jiangellaceae bacterium]|nr:Stk1 family PASTA domain-containing Ser/Thr kinase [Jiangellaceae bacterium]
MDTHVDAAPVGRFLDGRYRVEATLARGGMATVYRALDTRLDRVVALKVMHPELAVDDDFVARFIGEARSAAQLAHPAVVAVFDQGEDDGAVFLAMEYIEGRTLRQVLRDRGRLAPDRALDVIEPVLAALGAAHAAGIVHRDVKPENVLVADDGRVKVADFGLARALRDASTVTRGLLLGTVNYISPEQALGEVATPRSDVYSAGVMLYEMLTGSAPHTGPTDFVVVRSHIDNDVPAPSSVEPGVPGVVDDLVRRATARDPTQRFTDAADFHHAVQGARGTSGTAVPGLESREVAGVTIAEALTTSATSADRGRHTTAIPPAPGPVRRTTAREASHAAGRRSPRPRSRWRGPVAFTLVLLLALGAAVAAWWYGTGRYASTPSLLNVTVAEARAIAQAEGLTVVEAGEQYSEVVAAGLVAATEPGPGERVLRDEPIELTVSLGPERYEVPELVGLTREEAEQALADAHIGLGEVDEAFDEEVPENVVISQGVAAGELVRRDATVSLTVSKGREAIAIEDFTGRPAAEAQKALSDAGFDVSVKERFDDDVPAGVVIRQDPSSGTGYRGDQVQLEVSTGSHNGKIEVPSVVGMHVDQARQLLEGLGFRVQVRGGIFGGRQVQSQNPEAGQERERGTVVRLTLSWF